MSKPRRPYRVAAGARAVGVCEETMRRWINRHLVSVIRIGNQIFIPAEEIFRLTGTQKSVPDFKAIAAGDTE